MMFNCNVRTLGVNPEWRSSKIQTYSITVSTSLIVSVL